MTLQKLANNHPALRGGKKSRRFPNRRRRISGSRLGTLNHRAAQPQPDHPRYRNRNRGNLRAKETVWPETAGAAEMGGREGSGGSSTALAPRFTGSFDFQPWACIGVMNRDVAQAFQPAGSGIFSVPSIETRDRHSREPADRNICATRRARFMGGDSNHFLRPKSSLIPLHKISAVDDL